MHPGVGQHKRQRRQDDTGRSEDERSPADDIPEALVAPECPQGEGDGKGWKEEEVVAARQALDEQGQRGADQREDAARFGKAPQAEQRERHPLRGQDLQVPEVDEAIERKAIEEAGDESGWRVLRQGAREEVCPESRKDERRQEEQVVAEHEAVTEKIDGQYLDREREEVLGVGQRERRGVEDVRVPEPVQSAKLARSEAREVIEVPAEDPHVEQRVPEIARHARGEVRDHGPCQREREQQVEQQGESARPE